VRLKGDSTDGLPSSPLAEANRGEEGDYRTRTYVDMVGGWNFGKSCEPLVSPGCWPAGKIPVGEVAAVVLVLQQWQSGLDHRLPARNYPIVG
jgi:hypothetical protein